MVSTRILKVLSVLVLAVLSGCTVYSNIPAQAGDVATNTPNDGVVRRVIVRAVKSVVDHEGLKGEYTVVLPAGATAATYEAVLPKIGHGAVWTSDDSDLVFPVLRVKQVRIRGSTAEVDIERPADLKESESPSVLVTARLKWDLFTGWYATTLRIWRTGVDAEMRGE